MAWPPVPAMVTRAAAFDELVLDAAARCEPTLARRGVQVDFAVEDVPPDVTVGARDEVPLGRVHQAQRRDQTARVVVYRRPVEARCDSSGDLAHLVEDVVLEQVAALLGVAREDLLD